MQDNTRLANSRVPASEKNIRLVIELEQRFPTANRTELANMANLHPLTISQIRSTPMYKSVVADLQARAQQGLADRLASMELAKVKNAQSALVFQQQAVAAGQAELAKRGKKDSVVVRAATDMASIPLREAYKTPIKVEIKHRQAADFDDLDTLEQTLVAEGVEITDIEGEGDHPTAP